MIDLTNQRFERLTVLKEAGRKWGGVAWLCRCDCGNEIILASKDLRFHNTRSCGCLQPQAASAANTTHGDCQNYRRTPEWNIWSGMWDRCRNPNKQNYQYYGGRGIKVCDRWREFANFLEDMGRRPGPNYSIDRKDTDGNYEPNNCRWVTQNTQLRNRRKWLRNGK